MWICKVCKIEFRIPGNHRVKHDEAARLTLSKAISKGTIQRFKRQKYLQLAVIAEENKIVSFKPKWVLDSETEMLWEKIRIGEKPILGKSLITAWGR